MSSAELQLIRLIDFVTSPEGIVAVIAIIALAVLATTKPLIAWGFLVAATLTASLSSSALTDEADDLLTLAPGLAQLQAYGRVISIVGLAATIPFLLSPDVWRSRRFGARPINIAMLAFQLVIVLKFLEYRLFAYAVLGGTTFALIFFVMGANQTRWVPTWQAAVWPIRVIAAATGLFILGVAYQAVVNVSPMLGNSGRLKGLTTNPQHAATLLASGLPAICCVWEIERRTKWWGWFYLGLMLACVMMVAWTSSRTGGLMCFVAMAVLYRRQLHTFAIVGLLVLATTAGVSQQFEEFGDNAEMLTRTSDTRSAVWAAQWRGFLRYPLAGMPARGQNRLGLSENSWLGTAQALGIVGLIPLFVMTGYCVQLCRQCGRLYGSVDLQTQRVADTVLAGFAALAAGSIFEAYLLGVLNFQIFAIALYAMAGYAAVEAGGMIPTQGAVMGQPRYGGG